ncbi:hypothetical protein [Caproicibacter fermentans]|uniref:hypothetical protein n=1 Tax=Caproicibacter fermentans TaxID=2576756 RepID=UPI0012EE1380|nr:hypothetical protein [Caproicibacter fermentans]
MKRSHQAIHITFHNPKSAEDAARVLTKLLAKSLAENVIRGGTARTGSAEPRCIEHAVT